MQSGTRLRRAWPVRPRRCSRARCPPVCARLCGSCVCGGSAAAAAVGGAGGHPDPWGHDGCVSPGSVRTGASTSTRRTCGSTVGCRSRARHRTLAGRRAARQPDDELERMLDEALERKLVRISTDPGEVIARCGAEPPGRATAWSLLLDERDGRRTAALSRLGLGAAAAGITLTAARGSLRTSRTSTCTATVPDMVWRGGEADRRGRRVGARTAPATRFEGDRTRTTRPSPPTAGSPCASPPAGVRDEPYAVDRRDRADARPTARGRPASRLVS